MADPEPNGLPGPLRQQLRRMAKEQPRWGHKRVWGRLRLDGWMVNRKRVQRPWRAEGLRVPPAPPKRSRLGSSSPGTGRLRAEHPNHLWAMDFLFDTTADGRPFKVLSMCDEFTQESAGGQLGRSITADDAVAILDGAASERGTPKYIRCDNGPEFVAAAIRDWCRFSGTGAAYIDPGSPWQNAYVESFNSRARDDLSPGDLPFHHGSPGSLQRLAPSLQSLPTTQRPELAPSGSVRRAVVYSYHRMNHIATGPVSGVPTLRSPRSAPADYRDHRRNGVGGWPLG